MTTFTFLIDFLPLFEVVECDKSKVKIRFDKALGFVPNEYVIYKGETFNLNSIRLSAPLKAPGAEDAILSAVRALVKEK